MWRQVQTLQMVPPDGGQTRSLGRAAVVASVQEALAGHPVVLTAVGPQEYAVTVRGTRAPPAAVGVGVTVEPFGQGRILTALEVAQRLLEAKEVSAEVSDQVDEFGGRAVGFVFAGLIVAWAVTWAKIRRVF